MFQRASIQLGTSVANLLLAAFAAFLSRITRQDNVLISLNASHPSRFNFEADSTFRSAIEMCLDTFPLPPPHGALAPTTSENGSSRASKNSCSFKSESGAHYEFLADNESPSTHRDCALRLSVQGNGSRFILASPAGQWQQITLRNWLSYMLSLLNAAHHNPELPIDRLPLWDESEAEKFYESFNRTTVEFPGEATVAGRISAQAKRRPDATAVIFGARSLTYRELEERSNALAQHLISLGARPNVPIAVCMDRSAELPLALLAVLKSGAFYVPLDPHNPVLRLRGILEECEPAVLLSDSKTATALLASAQFSVPHTFPILKVDEFILARDAPEFRPAPATTHGPNQFPPNDPSDLAYTIYTSGTTGKPKGVRITHGALLNLICSMWRKPGAGSEDRTLAVAPISFDIATMDMFLPLCAGATLVIASRSDAVDPFRLARLMEDHGITTLQATPAMWRSLIASGWKGKRDLKMISGGEALPRELANRLLELGGELWNCYGPTETTIYSGVQRIFEETGIVPVGPPMPNTTYYVMDKAGFLLPPGIPGELYIGGVGVSPGYVARPELTADRFIPDPYGREPGALLFKTGDLVRIVRENQLEFFGRLDSQVKLRGFRIELEEIESVLRTHPSIADAVVVLREDIPGEPTLVAYVLSSAASTATDTPPRSAGFVLREYASAFLPEYMLPSMVVMLDRFPLSNSGKIDRRALPPPESIPSRIQGDYPAAESAADELESKLLRIFRECLNNDAVGVTDSFFRYGGYSVLTVRLFSRIDRELHVRLPISLLFDAPTVRELARVIRQGIAPPVIVPIRPYGRFAPVFIVQSYLLYNAMLEMLEPDRPVYGVREMGDEREPLSVEDRAALFAKEILSVCPNAPLYLAGWCAAGTLTVEIARQLRESGHSVGLVALFDAEHPGFTLPGGIKSLANRSYKKFVFHSRQIRRLPWNDKLGYVFRSAHRNWDWAVESFYMAHYRTMLWLKKHFGIALSEAAFNNVYASLASIADFPARSYPGTLNLFRASDVPDHPETDETLGWGTIAEGGVKVDFVPGDHVSMFQKPNVQSLAYRLQQELHRSETAPTG